MAEGKRKARDALDPTGDFCRSQLSASYNSTRENEWVVASLDFCWEIWVEGACVPRRVFDWRWGAKVFGEGGGFEGYGVMVSPASHSYMRPQWIDIFSLGLSLTLFHAWFASALLAMIESGGLWWGGRSWGLLGVCDRICFFNPTCGTLRGKLTCFTRYGRSR